MTSHPKQPVRSMNALLAGTFLCALLFLGAYRIPAQPTVPTFQLDDLKETAQPAAPAPTPEPTPTPAPTPEPTPEPALEKIPAANLALSTLRIVRINHYGEARPNGDGSATTVDAIAPETRSMRELMELGAHYTFTLSPPPGWDVLRITGAELTEVLDGQGNALNPWPAPPTDASESVAMSDTSIPVILRSSPPASGAQQLQKLSARVGMLLGKAQPVRVLDIKRQIDRSLLEKVTPQDIVFRITALDDTSVTLNAVGRIDRIGEIVFEDASGDPVEPFSRQIQTGNQETPSDPQNKDWRFQFEYIPPDLNMRMGVYLQIQAQTAVLDLTAVPLP